MSTKAPSAQEEIGDPRMRLHPPPCRLPGQFLQGIRPEVNALPDCPLIVFINARSGGNQGGSESFHSRGQLCQRSSEPSQQEPIGQHVAGSVRVTAGPDLARALSRALGRAQVFDLSVHKPEPVLAHLWENFKVRYDPRHTYTHTHTHTHTYTWNKPCG